MSNGNECKDPLKRLRCVSRLTNLVAWLQTSVWFLGERVPAWSSMRQTGFRMIVCPATSSHAGTLITNFVGPARLAQELSNTITRGLIQTHCLGRHTLGCVWILAFAILRIITEELDPVFDMLDPLDSPGNSAQRPQLPQLRDLPVILEKSNNLARIDRYLSTIEEFVSFFTAVRQSRSVDAVQNHSNEIPQASSHSPSSTASAIFEAFRAREKVQYEQKLCRTYMKQYDALIQVVSPADITQPSNLLTSRTR
ncbi:MAG: hypothetical protein Q9164_005549 [Protoblastenia rupestris]